MEQSMESMVGSGSGEGARDVTRETDAQGSRSGSEGRRSASESTDSSESERGKEHGDASPPPSCVRLYSLPFSATLVPIEYSKAASIAE